MKIALVFPGQGSQQVGMGKALADKLPVVQRVFDEADRALGMRLASLCFEGPDEELRLTANTQPAILTTCVAALRALEAAGVRADFVAGHSLGEYSALVAAGCLKFEDALRVVRQRGLFMQEAVPAGEGAMAALTGCDIELVNSVCREAAILGVCGPANINSPNQTVIAGHRPAVERAVELAKAAGARRTVMLAVSAPFHCELMKPAAERLGPLLAAIEFRDLKIPLVTNVDASMVTTGVEAREALIRQVASPVRWSDSVRLLIDNGVTRFIEVGPGKVLAGLIRQIDRESQVLSVADPDSLDATVASLQL
ncbi:MAG TPA: ACP S-malonyltransferase [Blastocatellia bacterium]|nr:ACP S-malonyltransferase [Blastocatellia bacterium]